MDIDGEHRWPISYYQLSNEPINRDTYKMKIVEKKMTGKFNETIFK